MGDDGGAVDPPTQGTVEWSGPVPDMCVDTWIAQRKDCIISV